jgi:hypothetical protein
LNLIRGESISIILAYIPNSLKTPKDKLYAFCKIEKDPVCQYESSGFGSVPLGEKVVFPQDGKKYLTSEIVVWGLKKDLNISQ